MTPEIQKAAVAVAKEVGYRNVTRAKVCDLLGKTPAWLQYRCPFKDLAAYLETNAAELGLVEGDTGGTEAKYSGTWAEYNRVRILEVAYALAERDGFKSFSRNDVARGAGVSAGVVNLRWGSMPELMDEVARQAITLGNTNLLRQAQACGNQVAADHFKGLDAVAKAG